MKITEKPWGKEIILEHNSRYALKEIFLNKGTRSSLQSHEVKLETILIIEGKMTLELENENGIIEVTTLSSGDHYTVLPGKIHRVTAIESLRLIEASTPELNDVIRHEDDFGRKK